MKYEALLAHDVSSYATVEIDAETDEAAIEDAKRMHREDTLNFSVEWDGVWNERIVHVAPVVGGKPDHSHHIAEGVSLSPDPLHDNAFALLQAAKAVKEWEAMMGGWEAPCWDALDAAIAKCEGR